MKKTLLYLAIAIFIITVPICGLAANVSKTACKPVIVTDMNTGTQANESIAAYTIDIDVMMSFQDI